MPKSNDETKANDNNVVSEERIINVLQGCKTTLETMFVDEPTTAEDKALLHEITEVINALSEPVAENNPKDTETKKAA